MFSFLSHIGRLTRNKIFTYFSTYFTFYQKICFLIPFDLYAYAWLGYEITSFITLQCGDMHQAHAITLKAFST
jgi:hypothetical protein